MPDNPKDKMSLANLVTSQSYALEAIINILDKKGIITRDEIIQELKEMQSVIFSNKDLEINQE
jgi:hypothetical protein